MDQGMEEVDDVFAPRKGPGCAKCRNQKLGGEGNEFVVFSECCGRKEDLSSAVDVVDASLPPADPSSSRPPADIVANAEVKKKNPCTKGCCKKKDDPAAPVEVKEMGDQEGSPAEVKEMAMGDVPPEAKKEPCAKGCCKKKEETPEASAPTEEAPPQVAVAPEVKKKEPCTKGCCKKKEEAPPVSEDAIAPTEEASPATVPPEVKKEPCAKGCCKKKEDPPPPTLLPADGAVNTAEASAQVLTAPSREKKDPCTKGCCEKTSQPIAEPPVTPPVSTTDPAAKGCATGCCDPLEAKDGSPESLHPLQELFQCCAACWGGLACCASECCSSLCCVVASVLPSKKKKRLEKPSKKKKKKAPSADDDDVEMQGSPAKSVTSQYVVEGIDCADCATTIILHMTKLPGIHEVDVKVVISLVTIVHSPELGATEELLLENLAEIGHAGRPVGSAAIEVVFPGVRKLLDLRPIIALLVTAPSVMNLKVPSRSTPEKLIISLDSSDPKGARSVLRLLEANGHPCRLADPPQPTDVTQKEIRYWAWSTLWCFIFGLPVFVIDFFLAEHASIEHVLAPGLTVGVLVAWILATPIQFYFCNKLYGSAYRSLRYSGRPNMDVMVVLSSLTAYLYSMAVTLAALGGAPPQGEMFFSASAVLLALIALGRLLEAIAKGRAVRLLASLLSLQPTTAILVEGEQESEVDIRLVQPGDLLKVLPGARIAADGTVEKGELSVDQAMLTGESLPVTKHAGDPLFAGTLNLSGMALYRAKATVAENSVSQLVQLVQSAETTKPKSARFADLAAAWFTPIAIGIALLVFIIWISLSATGVVDLAGSTPLPFSLHFALAALVVSCPCALALAAPVAIMVGSTISSRFHILIKGGAVMETCSLVNTVVFDKTGTLTIGKPEVTALFPEDPQQQIDFMTLAACVELGSEHVLARVIVNWAKERGADISQPSDIQTSPGLGIQGTVNGQLVTVGNRRWLRSCQVEISGELLDFEGRLSSAGSTIVFVGVNGRCVGGIALGDQVKPEARFVIEGLHASRREAWMLSGDNRFAALAVARQLGIPEARVVYEASPADKINHVRKLQEQGRAVMMIGDGINDAPALSQANVGVAVGAGADITQNSAQIVLARDNLADILVTLDLCRVVLQRIRINIAWAFLYNIIAIPMAAGVFYPLGFSIPPAFAGVSELLSSVPVLVSSLLLALYRPPRLEGCPKELLP